MDTQDEPWERRSHPTFSLPTHPYTSRRPLRPTGPTGPTAVHAVPAGPSRSHRSPCGPSRSQPVPA
eukprot:2348646-Prymnesium_polylepis.1